MDGIVAECRNSLGLLWIGVDRGRTGNPAGFAFMKQYAQSGVNIPVLGPAFSFSQDILPAIGDAALGVKNTATWAKDLDNEANKKFVEAFKAEYNRLPSIYAAQSWDTANLIFRRFPRRA